MKRFISFGSIGQFRTIIKKISSLVQYIDIDENTKEAIYDKSIILPTIKAIGTEKIHGTNASVCFSNSDGFWVQSRNNIIDAPNNPNFTGEADNGECALNIYKNQEAWIEIIKNLTKYHNIDLNKEIISIYFEWSGGNIQRKSAVSGLDKRAIIFQYFKVSPSEPKLNRRGEETSRWIETKSINYLDNTDFNIFNIMNFPKVQLEIDFNNPSIAQYKMEKFIESIEKNSLVGKAFGIEKNIGEGYVFTFKFQKDIYRFKIKGNKHAKGKGKINTLSPVKKEFENKKINFINNIACKEFRLDQIYNEVFDTINGGKGDKKKMSNYLRAVILDVMKEESDIMEEEGLTPKMVNGMISIVAKDYMLSRL